MGEKKLAAKFNYSYLYASFVLFHFSKSRLALRLMRARDLLLFPYYFCKVFYLRCGAFMRNFMLRRGWCRNKYIVGPFIIRKSKFPQNPKRSVRFSGKRTKRSVQKRKARNTQKAETKVL